MDTWDNRNSYRREICLRIDDEGVSYSFEDPHVVLRGE